MEASAKPIAERLLRWYDASHRSLPWRSPPGTAPPDPYRVWLSEVMLQQTTVAAVIPYFERFTARWPTVEALAKAPEADVLAAWAGLGYYARARNLIACARTVAAQGGMFPATEAELRALPGLGAYTAAAVAAIAFGQRAAVVDANVERVVTRLYAISTPLPAARVQIRAAVDAITPAERPGDFAQAMMDLGAGICTVRAPRCLLCPVSRDCQARSLGPEAFPVKPPKPARPLHTGKAFWIVQAGAVWLVRRAGKGLLGGMRALPDDGWSARHDGAQPPPLEGPWRAGGQVRHTFTHFDLELQLMLYSGSGWASLASDAGEWWPLNRLEEAGMPTVFAKAARLAAVDEELGEQR
jgi:A/G-specific adenine glycosylase